MKKIITILFFQFVFAFAQSQDLHFSQFYASPLTLSPSNTGFFNGNYRVGGNFKSQWPWANNTQLSNYRTFSGYADFALLQGKLPNKDALGVGLVVVNDRAGTGNLSFTKIMASIAYHKSFGRAAKYYLSFGVGGGYVQKGLEYEKLFFNDQWNTGSLVFDRGIGTSEPQGNNFSYFDLSAGMHFTYVPNPVTNVSIGVAFFHLNRPKESFNGQNNRLGIRPIVNIIARIQVSDNIHLEPSMAYTYQRKAQETVINLLAGFKAFSGVEGQKSTLFLGVAYRIKDAFIPVLGYQYTNFRLLLNYDVNLSSLTQASRANGGFEMSLVYVGKWKKTPAKKLIYCPRF